MISGIDIILITRTKIIDDPFGHPVYAETEKTVRDVLVSPSTPQEITDQMNLVGKKAVYTLAIPKDDTNEWENCDVIIFGERYHVFTPVYKGIDAMIPLRWNGKIMVERYEN